MTDDEIKMQALVALCVNCGQAAQKEWLRMCMGMVRKYRAETVQMAIVQVIREYTYKTLPPYGVIQKAIEEQLGIIDPAKARRLKALAEWTQLRRDIRELGPYQGPRADMHPTTAYVLRGMGGWDAACDWLTADMVWRERDFVEAWMQADGNVDLMNGGALAIEQAQGRAGGAIAASDALQALHAVTGAIGDTATLKNLGDGAGPSTPPRRAE